MSNIPFTVDRGVSEPLTAQLAGGLARGIESGFWKAGDMLPKLEDLAAETGVSMIVARHAMRQLVREGLVIPRPGFGTFVAERATRIWRGTVLIVDFEPRPNYSYSRISGILRERLLKDGFLPFVVTMIELKERKYDYSPLTSALRQPAVLAVVLSDLGDGPAVRMIRKAGIPVMTCSSRKRALPGVVAHIREDDGNAVADFVTFCADKGIRRIVQFHARLHGSALPGEALARHGVDVEDCVFDNASGVDPIENVQRGISACLRPWFDRNRTCLPDVIFINDDYATQAALLLLMREGVRIPEDVRLVSWVNRGSAPPYPLGLARIESDPFALGERLSVSVLRFLEGKSVNPLVTFDAVFHPDGTCC